MDNVSEKSVLEEDESLPGYLSEEKEKGEVIKVDQEDGEESTEQPSSLNKIVESMRSMMSLNKGSESPKIELVGDKLKRKKNRTKRRSAGVSYKKDANDRQQLKKLLGRHRSIVRYIGSTVPITPQNRQYFELFDKSGNALMSRASSFISTNLDQVRQHVDQVKYSVVPTLADLGQLVWDDLKFTEDEEEEEEEEDERDEDGNADEDGITFTVEETLAESPADESKDKPSDLEEVESSKGKEEKKEETAKISDLQDELAKLRAQIAMIVAAQSAPTVPNVPSSSNGQRSVAIVPPTMQPPPPPPPPPPPLPPPSFSMSKTTNYTPMKKKKETTSTNNTAPQNPMGDMLKGIANVKLKSTDLEKSPGGTPMRKNNPVDNPTNPADIIAKALREKFQNSNFNYESPENSPQSGFTPSPPSRKTYDSRRSQSTTSRPVPKPRPRPKPRVQKKVDTEAADETPLST